MEVSLRFLGHEGAPVIKTTIHHDNITVGTLVSRILQHNKPSGITAGQVKIICGGELFKHSSTLANYRWNTSIPIFYTYPQPQSSPSFFDFSACQTVPEALQAIADTAASTTGPYCPFSTRDSLFQTPLHHACKRFKDATVVRSLIAVGSDVNALDFDGFSPLFCAQSLEVVQELVLAKADPSIVVKGQTPLHRAVSGDIVDILIANGCVLNNKLDANPLTNAKLSSFTPLHCAASRNADVVLRLIHHKADVNARESSGKTPLHFAMNVDVAESLLSAKAEIDVRDARGYTALHYAHSAALARWCLRQGLRADANRSEIPSPIETVPEFETAVVLYEAGASYQQQFFQLDFGLQKGSEVSATKVKRYGEFQRFNAELALTGLCRGAAFAAAFGRRALYSTTSHPPVVSQLCLNILCPSGAGLPRVFACTGDVFRPEDKQGAPGFAGGAVSAMHKGRFSNTRRSFATLRISNGHYLRCTAAGGMAGLVVRRLFENSHSHWIRMPLFFPKCVLNHAASSVLAQALHCIVAQNRAFPSSCSGGR
jgi:ankyrin repeat protein